MRNRVTWPNLGKYSLYHNTTDHESLFSFHEQKPDYLYYE